MSIKPADIFGSLRATMESVIETYNASRGIIQETGVNTMARNTMRSKAVGPDHVNWLGIAPTGDLVFTMDEIVRGEIQSWRLRNTVVYLTRTGAPVDGLNAKPLKVTTWTNSELEHRETFDTIEEAQADWHDQIRQVSIKLATDVLVKS